ncbi:MAG: ATP-binding protein [Moraxellaceae bacterium]|jgi:signal transduction histidine kinase|nr:ATP-binding protein [Moraxellaceae bacterium]
MALTLFPEAGAHRRNLVRLCLLRGVLVLALLLATGLVFLLQGIPLYRDGGLVLAVLLFTGFNFWTLWRLRRGVSVGEAGIFLQLVVDVLLMTLVLYRTGGATNPFVSYYLVPLTIAAATLRLRFTISVALLTLVAYSMLLSHYIPFSPFEAEHGMVLERVAPVAPVDPHAGHQMPGAGSVHSGAAAGLVAPAPGAAMPEAHGQMAMSADAPELEPAATPAGQGSEAVPGSHAGHGLAAAVASGFNLHVFGMWLNFLLSAGLITFFVSRMSHALHEQDRRLAEQHEHLLQREQVVALGALAAGAAHELGTPLATMSVIAREIEAELPADSPLREEAVLLRGQLALCREILQGLRAQAAGELPRQPLSALVGHAVTRMEVMYPARIFTLVLALPDRLVQAPATLPQVLVNLLDNAAQAARAAVEIRVAEDGGEWLLEVRDDGAGIPPEVASRLGEPFVSGRAEGLGIGYFLSHASVNQWGGSIRLQPRTEGGTLTILRLPWTVLQPGPLPEAP